MKRFQIRFVALAALGVFALSAFSSDDAQARRRGLFGGGIFKKIGGAFKSVGAAVQKVGQKIGEGVKKVGAVVKKVGEKVKEGVKKVGAAIKKGIQAIGKFFKGSIEALKKKLIEKVKGFAERVLKPVKEKLAAMFDALIEKLAGKIGIGMDALEALVDPETGKANMGAIKALIVSRIADWARPWVEDKVRWLVDKGMAIIKPLLDGAVAVVIGAVGSIPFAGGVLAAALNVAFGFAIGKLVDFAVEKATDLAVQGLSALVGKGFDFLVTRIPALQRLADKIAGQALRLGNLIKKAKSAQLALPRAMPRLATAR